MCVCLGGGEEGRLVLEVMGAFILRYSFLYRLRPKSYVVWHKRKTVLLTAPQHNSRFDQTLSKAIPLARCDPSACNKIILTC